jgi:hypothetical protein
MKYSVTISLALIFITIVSFGQIADLNTCNKINSESIEACLIESLGNEWHKAFCRSNGKFFFTALVDTLGTIKQIAAYNLQSGISKREFSAFRRNLRRRYKLCVSNNNPEMSEIYFKDLVTRGKVNYTFFYQGKGHCNL